MFASLKQPKGWLVMLLLGFSGQAAWAVECYKNGATSGSQNALETISIPILAIPADMPVGSKIWESEVINVTAYCGRVKTGIRSENIYFYFNPRGASLDPGAGLAFGMEIISPVKQDLDDPQARFDTGVTVYRRTADGPVWVDVPVAFRLYLKTTVLPNNTERPLTGNYDGPNTFQAFQFDGVKGVNIHEGLNLRYDLTNLRNIRFLACGADVTVLPANQSVNFGTLNVATIGSAINIEKSFTLRAVRRGCADKFSIDLRMDPKGPILDNQQQMNLENGLQIGIYDQGSPVKFGKYYPFATFDGSHAHDKTYVAKLSRIPGEDIKKGPFNASLIYRINYK